MNVVKKTTPYLIVAAIIGAGLAVQGLMNSSSDQGVEITGTFTETFIPASETPSITPTYNGCAFVWAYHDAAEASAQLQKAIKNIQPSATASAQQYGEDCIYGDGTSTFGAMETDFYITFDADLKKDDELGTLIIQGMSAVKTLPAEIVSGGQPGKVTFTFKQGNQQLSVQVDIKTYNKLSPGLSGADVYKKFSP